MERIDLMGRSGDIAKNQCPIAKPNNKINCINHSLAFFHKMSRS